MNLDDIRARGALVLSPPVPRDIQWVPVKPLPGDPPGEPIRGTVYIRTPSSGWLDRARTAAARNGAVSYRSAIISHAVLWGRKGIKHPDPTNPGDFETLSYEDADLLDDALADELMRAYNAVNYPPPAAVPGNGATDDDEQAAFAKNTGPTHGSGTSSPDQASADEPLPPSGNH